MAYGSFLMGETEGKLDLVLMGRAMLSKYLIQFSVDGCGCVPSLFFELRPNYGGGNEDNGNFLQNVPCTHCYTQCPQPCSKPLSPHTSAGDSWIFMDKSGSVSYGVTAPFSWVQFWHTQAFVCAFQESVSPVLCKFWQLCCGVNGDLLQEGYAILRSTSPRVPAHVATHCSSVPLQETLKHSSGSVSVGSLGPGSHICLSPLSISGVYGV